MSANTRAARPISALDIGVALMILASVAVIAVPDDYLRTHYVIDPTVYSAQIIGDEYVNGKSQARWIDENSQHWECQLLPGADDPFCSLQITVTDAADKGLDLSRYDRITLWADYEGAGTHFRFYLRNRHPSYYDPANSITTKYNMIELPVDTLAQGLNFQMSDFTVAGWWLIGGNLPLSFANPEFNEVAIIEVQTGSRVRSGTHQFQLKKIVLSGSLIQRNSVYQTIIVAWSVLMLAVFTYRFIAAKRELQRQREHQQELLAMNALLNIENRRNEELAKTDALTGLRNRLGIRDILHEGLVQWRKDKTPFSLIMIDLDHFKKINDIHGHDAGDAILKEAAHLFLNHVRHTDSLARWGGEEFVLACPNTSLDQAIRAAENLRAALAEHITSIGIGITASFGVATINEPNLDHLFKKADASLYQAKHLGRNRVCSEPLSLSASTNG